MGAIVVKGGKRVHTALRAFAFKFPGAWEDHPWGESVAKVDKKVFAFFGLEGHTSVHLKLPHSGDAALGIRGAEQMDYGLGKAGWVSIPLDGDLPPIEILREWIEESYRAVATKKRAKELDVEDR
jgi:predicted DNA-binding protein (MmcQ/YjbR family)